MLKPQITFNSTREAVPTSYAIPRSSRSVTIDVLQSKLERRIGFVHWISSICWRVGSFVIRPPVASASCDVPFCP